MFGSVLYCSGVLHRHDMIFYTETLVKMCLEECGSSVTPEMVERLSGNNSGEKKESTMAAFQTRFIGYTGSVNYD